MSQTARRFCTFWLADEYFGLDIRAVREIRSSAEVTPVPGAHAAVCGLLNLRGQVATVLDPAAQLGLAALPGPAEQRLIVLKTNAEIGDARAQGVVTSDDLVALRVDRVADVIAIADAAIDAVPAAPEAGAEPLLEGVALIGEACVRILVPQSFLSLRGGR